MARFSHAQRSSSHYPQLGTPFTVRDLPELFPAAVHDCPTAEAAPRIHAHQSICDQSRVEHNKWRNSLFDRVLQATIFDLSALASAAQIADTLDRMSLSSRSLEYPSRGLVRSRQRLLQFDAFLPDRAIALPAYRSTEFQASAPPSHRAWPKAGFLQQLV